MRFYGGTPRQWLTDEPMYAVRACLRMVPRLVAEESIQRANEAGVGTGSLGKAGKKLARRWVRVATGASKPKPMPPGQMRAVGIGFRRQAKKTT